MDSSQDNLVSQIDRQARGILRRIDAFLERAVKSYQESQQAESNNTTQSKNRNKENSLFGKIVTGVIVAVIAAYFLRADRFSHTQLVNSTNIDSPNTLAFYDLERVFDFEYPASFDEGVTRLIDSDLYGYLLGYKFHKASDDFDSMYQLVDAYRADGAMIVFVMELSEKPVTDDEWQDLIKYIVEYTLDSPAEDDLNIAFVSLWEDPSEYRRFWFEGKVKEGYGLLDYRLKARVEEKDGILMAAIGTAKESRWEWVQSEIDVSLDSVSWSPSLARSILSPP